MPAVNLLGITIPCTSTKIKLIQQRYGRLSTEEKKKVKNDS
jgi:hypothetical protein